MKEMAMYDQPYYGCMGRINTCSSSDAYANICVYARAHLPYDEWPAGDRGKGRVA